MCQWLRKVKFDCGCSVFNDNHRLFPRACPAARKDFCGKHPEEGVEQELFCPLPPGGAGSSKMRIRHMCSYHYKDGLSPRDANKRAARKPIDYPSATELAMSGLFASVFEGNTKEKIMVHALGWERGELVAHRAEEAEISGRKQSAKATNRRDGESKEIGKERENTSATDKRREDTRSLFRKLTGLKEANKKLEEVGSSSKMAGYAKEDRGRNRRRETTSRVGEWAEASGRAYAEPERADKNGKVKRKVFYGSDGEPVSEVSDSIRFDIGSASEMASNDGLISVPNEEEPRRRRYS